MDINIIHRTYEYRGDHSADISIAYSPKANETVDELINRIKPEHNDVIEIRLIKYTP